MSLNCQQNDVGVLLFFAQFCHMDFGRKIKELRIKKQLTQSELADQTGLTLRTLQRIENGEVKASLHSKRMLGQVLNFDLEEKSSKEEQSIEIKITIKNMNHLLEDIRVFWGKHWKLIFFIILVLFLLSNYTDIKSGFSDGWLNK